MREIRRRQSSSFSSSTRQQLRLMMQATPAAHPMALTLLIVSFTILALCPSAKQIAATSHQQQQNQQQQYQPSFDVGSSENSRALWPPVYVVQDEPQPSSRRAKSWDNRKLTVLQNSSNNNNRPAMSSSISMRRAKQLARSEEPFPYSLAYKQMGFGLGEGSHADQHYQPLRRSQFNSETQWQSRNAHSTKTGSRKQQPGVRSSASGARPRKANKSPANKSHTNRPLPPVLTGASNPISPAVRGSRPTSSAKKNLVCYYGSWAVYRPDGGKYPVENIDPFLCTHIIYGFTGLSYDNLIKPLDPWNDLEDNYGKGAMKRFTNLKRINPDLKTLVAIGGWNEGSIKYSKMASEPEARAKFVKSVVDFLAKYNFDGLDLDWEYPAARGGYSYDRQNFVTLLRELKQAFEPHGYLLTAAVSAGKWFIDPAYDIPQVSKYLDLINLMTYDYHGGWESKTGINAPLFSSKKYDLRDDALLNVNWSVNYWLQKGAAPEKIILGVGSYGRSFTLDRADNNGINAPASQKGQAGPYTREPGSLGYNEICENFKRNPQAWTIVRDPDYLAPYAYNDRQWVGYDDMESLALKTQYAKSMGLGGMMMWSLETDDFSGRCHDEKYPLLNTIKRVLDGAGPSVPPRPTRPPGGSQEPSTTPSTSKRPTSPPTTPGREVEDEVPTKPASTTRRPSSSTRRPRPPRPTTGRPNRPTTAITTTTTTTVEPTSASTRRPSRPTDAQFVCRADGMFGDPKNCRKFIRCVSSGSNYALFRFDCAPGTAYNGQFGYCDHIYNVPSCKQTYSDQPQPVVDSDDNERHLVGSRQQQRLHNQPTTQSQPQQREWQWQWQQQQEEEK